MSKNNREGMESDRSPSPRDLMEFLLGGGWSIASYLKKPVKV